MDDTFVSLKSFIKCKTLFYVCNKQFQMNNYTCQNKPLCKFSFKNKEMQVFFPSNKPITKNTIISWTISTGNERKYQSRKGEKQISYID